MDRLNLPIFQSIKNTVKTTGLSEYYLRQNIKNGNIPYIKSGTKILINIPRFLNWLDNQTPGYSSDID